MHNYSFYATMLIKYHPSGNFNILEVITQDGASDEFNYFGVFSLLVYEF
jgi:hypothetical protein